MFAYNIHDSVFGMCENSRWGTFGEYAVFKAKDLALKPRELSWAKAAALPVAAVTAYDAFGMVTKRLDTIQKILILDDGRSGGITQMLILLAKNYFMIRQVIVSCPSIHFEYYRSLGADMLIEMSTQRFDDYLMTMPAETTGMVATQMPTTTTTTTTTAAGTQMPTTTTGVGAGIGGVGAAGGAMMGANIVQVSGGVAPMRNLKEQGYVDVIFDCIGGHELQQRGMRLLGRRGSYINTIFPGRELEAEYAVNPTAAGKVKETVGLGKSMLKQRMRSLFGTSAKYYTAWPLQNDARKVKTVSDFLYDKGLLDRIHWSTLGFDELPTGMNRLVNEPYEGKFVVRIGGMADDQMLQM